MMPWSAKPQWGGERGKWSLPKGPSHRKQSDLGVVHICLRLEMDPTVSDPSATVGRGPAPDESLESLWGIILVPSHLSRGKESPVAQFQACGTQ